MTEKQEEIKNLINTYTGGYPRRMFWVLTGNAKASIRAHIMAVLLDKPKVPQSKAGITALREKLVELFGAEGDCYAALEDNLFEKMSA